jgi:hypothetical protein
MAKTAAMSVHIGVNQLDRKHYAGWDGKLVSCGFDAADMAAIAKSRGIKHHTLGTKDATRANVLAAIRAAARQTTSGGFFLLTFSGHGGQVQDVNGDEMDAKDETWCLYDGQLVDDELRFELGRFAEGSRILVIADCAACGTVERTFAPDPDPPPVGQRSKLLPYLIAERTCAINEKFYTEIQKKLPRSIADSDIGPAIVFFTACQVNQTAIDGKQNGAFTARLRQVWNQGSFDGCLARFHAVITAGMPSTQSPGLRTLGPATDFLAQLPFKP